MNPVRGLSIFWQRLVRQGLQTTGWWAADHAVRIITGAPIRRVAQLSPQLYVGGQYRSWGWTKLRSWGVTAIVNLRAEFDDHAAHLAPDRYLHLPTDDDQAPSLEQLRSGVAFIAQEIERGGSVYVHCGSGVGRAPTLVAAYLIYTGLLPDQAWARIRQVRPFIRPTHVQVEQIEKFRSRQAVPYPKPGVDSGGYNGS